MIKKFDGIGFALATSICITFAITSTVANSLVIGITTFSVLIVVNVITSLIRNIVNENMHITTYLVVCAAVVSITELLFDAYFPMEIVRLDIFIPLIVISCITLSGTGPFTQSFTQTIRDTLLKGASFVLLSILVGMIREFFGTGWLFGRQYLPDSKLAHIFVLAPGALITLGLIMAGVNSIKLIKK
jgi:Na+-translocating ferredoxin:NAD+ oxidoreductase subunit E